MLSKYIEFQVLIPDVSGALVAMSCVPAAFTLLFASVLALFYLWMKENSGLRYFAGLRAIPSCLASCLLSATCPECMCHQLQEICVFKAIPLPAAPLYDLSGCCEPSQHKKYWLSFFSCLIQPPSRMLFQIVCGIFKLLSFSLPNLSLCYLCDLSTTLIMLLLCQQTWPVYAFLVTLYFVAFPAYLCL